MTTRKIQNYIIIGATGGVGAELSRSLAAEGGRLLLAGRDENKLERIADECEAEKFVLDASHPEQVEACLKRGAELFDQIDGVANCVGSLLLKPAHVTSDDEWQHTIRTNLDSAFFTVRSAAKAMMKNGGSVVLVSSAAARVGLFNHEAIAAAKAGVEGLVLAAASSYARYGLRFNAVAPGLTRTPMTERLTANETSEKASIDMHALGRLGETGDIASAIAWLLDPEQSWITGQVLGVDGGLSRVRPRQKA